jgi:hypothetical protein
MALVGLLLVTALLATGAVATEKNMWPVATARAGVGPAPRWHVVARGPAVPDLFAVSARSTSDVWVLGETDSDSKPTTVIAHWDGERLRVVKSFPSSQPVSLSGIATVGTNDVWAVGSMGKFGSRRALALHWDGTVWTRLPLPTLVGESWLEDVRAPSPNDVWVAGGDEVDNAVTHLIDVRPLVLHWDGHGWQHFSESAISKPCSMPDWDPEQPPTPFRCGLSLDAIDVTPAKDLWAIGTVETIDFAGYRAVAVHWNGHHWTELPSELGTRGADIDAVSGKDAWTVADYTDEQHHDSGKDFLLTRWTNGTPHTYLNATSLDPHGDGDVGLSAVAATSKTSFWAVGSRGQDRQERPLLIHSDGRTISVAHTALDALRGATLAALAELTPADIWAAGNHLLARYSGDSG